MASRKLRLTVVVAPTADDQLDEIYLYNLKNRGLAPANRYLAFLDSKIDGLSTNYDAGKPVKGMPHLRYSLMKKRTGGDGHLAVYSIDVSRATVNVLFIFHTKQDWENKL